MPHHAQTTDLHVYTVGKLYHPERTRWPEVTEYAYRDGGHQLRLFWRNLTPSVVRAVAKGPIHFGLLVRPPVVWLLYRIDGACDWSDAPYSIHLEGPDAPAPPDPELGADRALLTVILVDADTGLVRALRGVSSSPPFTAALHAAIRAQAAAPFDRAAYDAAVRRDYAHFPQTAAMVREAVVLERGGL